MASWSTLSNISRLIAWGMNFVEIFCQSTQIGSLIENLPNKLSGSSTGFWILQANLVVAWKSSKLVTQDSTLPQVAFELLFFKAKSPKLIMPSNDGTKDLVEYMKTFLRLVIMLTDNV